MSKKNNPVEEEYVVDEVQNVEEKDSPKQEQGLGDKPESKSKPKSKDVSEPLFISPYGRILPPMQGKFVETIGGVHAVFEDESGAKYVVPYNHEVHGQLKQGDSFVF